MVCQPQPRKHRTIKHNSYTVLQVNTPTDRYWRLINKNSVKNTEENLAKEEQRCCDYYEKHGRAPVEWGLMYRKLF